MSRQIFTLDAQKALSLAQTAAEQRHSPMIGTEHLLLGCLSTDFVKHGLAATSVDADALRRAVENELATVRDEPLPSKDLSPAVKRLLENSADISRITRTQGAINSGHMAIVLLSKPEPYLAEVLQRFPQLNMDAFTQYVQANGGALQVASGGDKSGKAISMQDFRDKQPKSRRDQKEDLRNVPPHLRPKASPKPKPTENPNLPVYIGLLILGAILYGASVAPSATIALVIVVGGWILSLVLHEFAHALVAYWGGDHTVVDKGYLTMNPLKYTHPLLSIGMPLLFLAMGGIGLPGGMVYIERHRLRSNIWNSYVSAAGPFANLICMIVFSAPFWTGYVTPERYDAYPIQCASLAFLVYLEAFSIFLNLLPIPPLDGFGIIEPFLPSEWARQLRSIGMFGFLIVFLLLRIDTGSGLDPSDLLGYQSEIVVYILDVELWQVSDGFDAFFFWG